MNKVCNKIAVLFLTLAMIVTMIPQMNSVHGDENKLPANVQVEYTFANSDAGSADGSIKITTDQEGLYYFYWGDSNSKKLSNNGVEYSELGWCQASYSTSDNKIEGTYRIASPYTAVPKNAKKILVYYKDTTKVQTADIPSIKEFNGGTSTYRFGLLSDVHFNRYNTYAQDDSVPAFDNALKFLNDNGIDFVAMTGDLSKAGETSAYIKYKTAIDKYPNMTVYTCTGNHDDSGLTDFKKYVNVNISKDSNIKNVGATGLDFVYEKGGDIFIFFSQTSWSYNSKTSSLVTPDQLNWLEKNLNKYADKKIYLMFHTYFASENGDVTTAVGNLKNPGGYTYDLTYTFGNTDEKRFRTLLNKYSNVTMFSGHSHWAYSQQSYNPNLNIGNISSNNSGATLVHVSSVGDPRIIGVNDTKRTELNGVASEGTIAERYSNATVYTGVDFTNNKYLAYATYLIADGKTSQPTPIVSVGKTKITSVGKAKKVSKKSKKYKVKIKYKKISGAVGYQIKYSTTKSFKAKRTKTKYSKKKYYTITKLKNKTKYYVKVRAYKKQFGEKVYGKFSKAKTIKIKKK